ncbi:unnamed protein product [Microthlaspi erraticum]|uniref:MULE transposase domain-containing protein n=1 Tax=Microthlaspi erraticum TaxID=1685480 RepID=A0A6D2KUP2_9BRAS|nr:unnamed protein product [Microthlaspi erraticum]
MEWTIRDRKWYFEVDKTRGGRMFYLQDDCKHEELVEMVVNDYMLQVNGELLELSYPLPAAMMEKLPTDSPPMYVTNDRQVGSLVELCKEHVVRLCVSTRVGMGRNYNEPIHECVQEEKSEEVDKEDVEEEFGDEGWDDNESDDVNWNDKAWDVNSEDESDDTHDNDSADDVDNPDDIDADYSKYGKVKDEEEGEESLSFRERLRRGVWNGGNGGFTGTWCDTILLRAAVKNEPDCFWVTKFDEDHVWLNLTYTTSYRALKFAQVFVRGTPEDGYANLPSYLRRLKQANPGTITHLLCDEEDRFKYCFVALAASTAGFQYLKRVIVVDGTHLTGKYGGTLLVACGQDANFQVFPLAYGVVDAETNESWGWFFDKLQTCFSPHPMVIVSDRALSIENACVNVLPWVTRGICYYHLQQNIIKTYGGKELMYLVKGAAYAHTLAEYNRCMDSLRAAHPDLAAYMELADPKLWSRVHFPGDRYNIKTSNIAESINSAIKKAKGFPIPSLLQFIREMLGRWFYKRREDALSLQTPYSKGVEYILAIREHYAQSMDVQRIDATSFHVAGRSHL